MDLLLTTLISAWNYQLGFPKGASIPLGQNRGQYPGREVVSFIMKEFLA